MVHKIGILLALAASILSMAAEEKKGMKQTPIATTFAIRASR